MGQGAVTGQAQVMAEQLQSAIEAQDDQDSDIIDTSKGEAATQIQRACKERDDEQHHVVDVIGCGPG